MESSPFLSPCLYGVRLRSTTSATREFPNCSKLYWDRTDDKNKICTPRGFTDVLLAVCTSNFVEQYNFVLLSTRTTLVSYSMISSVQISTTRLYYYESKRNRIYFRLDHKHGATAGSETFSPAPCPLPRCIVLFLCHVLLFLPKFHELSQGFVVDCLPRTGCQ